MDRRGQGSNAVATGPAAPVATRPRFRERQVLRALDLEAEQSYLIATRRRHNIAHHGWGIVRGLELITTHDGVAVEPGMAVDGYGRELIVSEVLAIPLDAFQKLEREVLDVWLCYDLVQVNVPQRGSWDCGPGRNGNVREVSRLRLTPGAAEEAGRATPRSPVEVPFEDLPFLPNRPSPDDPVREWPVYLGTIRHHGVTTHDPRSPRPYATVSGEVVVAPSGGARMQVGSELATDTRRFAVSVADAAGNFVERLAVDRAGNTIVTGKTTVRKHIRSANAIHPRREVMSNFRMRANPLPSGSGSSTQTTEALCGAVERSGDKETPGAARMIHFQPLPSPPAAAAPWQIYRTSIKRDGRTIRQLRIEIGHPGDKGDPALSRIIFGTRDGGGAFNTSLMVSADCTVTINGDVTVSGEFSEGPVKAEPTDPRFTELIASQWVEGTVVGQVRAAPGTLRVTVRDPNQAVVAGAAVIVTNASRSFNQTGQTDQAGQFGVSGLAAGIYTVRVVAPGFPPLLRENVNVAAGETVNLPLSLPARPGSIEGTLRDASNIAISNATVDLAPVVTSGISEAVTVITNNAGRFVFPDVPAGRYGLGVTRSGFDPFSTTVEVGDAQTVIRDIRLSAQTAVTTGTISGTVFDNANAVVAGATVELENLSTGRQRISTTSDDGSFTFDLIAAGSYRLRVANNAAVAPVDVVLQAGRNENVVLRP